MAQSTYTYELTEDQQNVLLMIMEGGNYRKRTVPYSLMYVYKNWAYVNYKGECGWASLDYIDVQEDDTSAQAGDASQGNSSQADGSGSGVEPAPDQNSGSDSAAAEPEAVEPKQTENTEKEKSSGSSFMESRAFLILFGCAVAAVTALVTAIIVLRLVSRSGKH